MKVLIRITGIVSFLAIPFFIANSQQSSAVDSFRYFYQKRDYSKALVYWTSIEDSYEDFDLIKNAGDCFVFTGEYDRALNIYSNAVSLISDTTCEYFTNLLISFSRVYVKMESIENARNFLNRAIYLNNIFDHDLNYKIFTELGKLYEKANRYDSAEYYHLKAFDHYKKFKKSNPEKMLLSYINIFKYYNGKGEYQTAKQYAKEGLELAKRENNSNFIFQFTYCIAICQYSLKDYYASAYYLNKSLELMTSHNLIFKPYIESSLTYCYSKIYPDKDSKKKYEDTSIYDSDETDLNVYNLIYYGKFLESNENNSSKALKYFYISVDLFSNKYEKYAPQSKEIYSFIAYSHYKLHRPDSALYYYQRALYCRNPETDTADYASNPPNLRQCDRWVLDVTGRKIRALNMLRQGETDADSCLIIDRLIAANATYYASLVEVLLRDKTFLADQMHLLRENIRSYMLAGMDACYALYEKSGGDHYFKQALAFSETGKYLLLKSMMDSRANKQRLPDSLAALDSELHGRINRLHMDIERRKANGEDRMADSLDKALFALILRKDSLRNVILQQVPGIQRWETHDVDIDAVMESLPPGQVLVEYYLQDSVLHSFMLSGEGGMQWTRKALDKDFFVSVENVIRTCNPFEASGVDMQTFCESSFFLFNILLGDAHAQDLLLIPDGPLTYLPFEVLLTGMPETGASWRGLPYLLRSHRVARYHSLRFVKPDNQKKYTSINFLALAPSFGGDTAFAGWDLPAAHEEAGQLMELFDGTILLDTAATVDGFMHHAAGKQILHFATHARTDSSNAFDSRLMLSGGTAGSAPQPLYASDICSMDLDAALAVLSSCNSGNGTLLQGEGVISLAWAFRYAGCESVAMSLFPLDDLSAKAVMAAFYRHLKAGKPRNEALRSAKLEYLETTVPFKSHPQYWAGIVLSGNPAPLVTPLLKRPLIQATLLIAGVALVMVVLLMAGKKQKGRST